MNIVDVEIPPYGLIIGRDALILEELKWDSYLNLELRTNASTSSFSSKINIGQDEINLILSFKEVYMFRVSELEMKGLMSVDELNTYLSSCKKSIFVELINSNIILENKQYNRDVNLRHFILTTYDFRIEIICQSFVIKEI
ncbi:hypothetical protein CAPN006_21170 [Capnocytophaga canimorsus]|uniref:hypothetical protein n=1 Tax=Capnocytophaga canimorsus TaxID=28188 RepID=UPI001AC0948F|nr:hypothetical protein [Capnocytophaga canimorsus]GIM57725.1 hypothetical protein CAPN006_21170 [Capnocytophaga canimorsus]